MAKMIGNSEFVYDDTGKKILGVINPDSTMSNFVTHFATLADIPANFSGTAQVGTQLYVGDGVSLIPVNKATDYFVTTRISRTDNTPFGTPIPVTSTVNGIVGSGNIIKNAAGEILEFFGPTSDTNASTAYARVDPIEDVTRTKEQLRTKVEGTVTTNQHRTITRNASNEILVITPWSNV